MQLTHTDIYISFQKIWLDKNKLIMKWPKINIMLLGIKTFGLVNPFIQAQRYLYAYDMFYECSRISNIKPWPEIIINFQS